MEYGCESEEYLIEMCIEQELVVGNTLFKNKIINKYTWGKGCWRESDGDSTHR